MSIRGLAAAAIAAALGVAALGASARAQPRPWRSPSGLVYRDVASVLAHTRDDPTRRVHGVFQGDPRPLIEEAWARVRAGGPDVASRVGDRERIVQVDMGRPIGWLGGHVGAATGRPAARYLRLVLDAAGQTLLAAYPTERPLQPRPTPPHRTGGPPSPSHPPVSEARQRHLLFGMPSAAGTTPDDYLLLRDRYVLSYHRGRRVLNWASWSLREADFGDISKQRDFRPDDELPVEWGVRPDDEDYAGSGLTRGHMVPSGETTADRALNSSTYLFSNIFPQAESVNGGPWNKMENYYRDLVRFEGKEAYLIAGTIFKGPTRTIGRGLHVPTAAFKIVVLLDRGQTLADVTPATRVIAAVMPNTPRVSKDAPWSSFRTSVADIERQTGLRFFSTLPPTVADALRQKVDHEQIPDTDHPRWLELQAGPGHSLSSTSASWK